MILGIDSVHREMQRYKKLVSIQKSNTHKKKQQGKRRRRTETRNKLKKKEDKQPKHEC